MGNDRRSLVSRAEFQRGAIAVRNRDTKVTWSILQQLVCSLSKGILFHGPSSAPTKGAFDTGTWSEFERILFVSEAGQACGMDEEAVYEAQLLRQAKRT